MRRTCGAASALGDQLVAPRHVCIRHKYLPQLRVLSEHAAVVVANWPQRVGRCEAAQELVSHAPHVQPNAHIAAATPSMPSAYTNFYKLCNRSS